MVRYELFRAGRGSVTVSPRTDTGWIRTHAFAAFLAVASVACAGSNASAENATTHIDVGKNGIGGWAVLRDPTAMAGLAIEQSGVERTADRFPLSPLSAPEQTQ
jgi:hypothetical protein